MPRYCLCGVATNSLKVATRDNAENAAISPELEMLPL